VADGTALCCAVVDGATGIEDIASSLEQMSDTFFHVDPAIDPASVKQVIVIRRDLHMRRGKEIAQGAHASSAWISFAVAAAADAVTGRSTVELDPVALLWITGSFRKVTLQVQTDDELLALHEHALELGLRSHLITDSGRTEFAGVPTRTALAIGPNIADQIDLVTGELSIY
jgi:peptidyl-tRNA hydrolase, PTH2 family